MKSHQLEIKTAFLNEALEDDVYVEQPDGYQEGGPSIGCHLHRALYALKQALRAWHIQLSEMGFRPLDADAGLLYRDDNSGRTWLLVYADDILIVARTRAEVHGLQSVIDSSSLSSTHMTWETHTAS